MSDRDNAAPGGPILVCYDASPDAEHAIRRASELLGGGDAVVLYVWLPPSALLLAGRVVSEGHPLGEQIEEFDDEAGEEAERVARKGAEIASKAGFDVSPRAERGGRGIWRTIVGVADEIDARAVVLGSHGRSPAVSAVLGSTSQGVVNHCGRPVIVAPCSGDHRDEASG